MAHRFAAAMVGLAVAASAAFFAPDAAAQISVQDRLAPGQPPVIAPFRGVAEGYPEGSLAGMEAALAIGAGLIDIQVQVTADGHHVVFHDQFLNRLTDVETVFETGAPGGPSREDRAGRDYLGDYTLSEIRQLHLRADGVLTEHGIATLEQALDLVEGESLALLTLNDFDLETLVAQLSARPTDHLLVYSVDPEVLQAVVDATGLPAFVSLRRSRVFDTSDSVAILDAHADLLGDAIALALVQSTGQITPELLARSEALGVRLSALSGRETFALEDGDTLPWREALTMEVAVFWTTHPGQVLDLLQD